MAYSFHVTAVLRADNDEDAKEQAAQIMLAFGVMVTEGMIDMDEIGIALEGPNGETIDLPSPQFPEGSKR